MKYQTPKSLPRRWVPLALPFRVSSVQDRSAHWMQAIAESLLLALEFNFDFCI